MSWYPHVTVATVVEKSGKFLLVEEQAEGHKVFNQPAGHLDPNETLEQAAVRETLEESAWTVKPTAIVGIYLYTSEHNGITYHRTTFAAEPIHHCPDQALDNGIFAAHWLTYEQILERREQLRSPLVLKAIDDYRQGQRWPLSILDCHVDNSQNHNICDSLSAEG